MSPDGAASATAETDMGAVKERFSPAQMARRVARGELGEVRVIIGIAVIWTIFQIADDKFLSAINLSNLTLQIAAIATISIGVVLVLLLGQMVVGEVQWRNHLVPWWLILIHVTLATAVVATMAMLAARLVGRMRPA